MYTNKNKNMAYDRFRRRKVDLSIIEFQALDAIVNFAWEHSHDYDVDHLDEDFEFATLWLLSRQKEFEEVEKSATNA